MDDYFEMWQKLLLDIEHAVQEGLDEGFDMHPDTVDGGKLIAYKYVLNKMHEFAQERRKR